MNFSILKKGFSVLSGTLAVSISNFIIAIILTKNQGISYYGEFAFYQACFLTWCVVTKPNTWQAIIKFAPGNNLYHLIKKSAFGEVLSCVILSIITFALVWFMHTQGVIKPVLVDSFAYFVVFIFASIFYNNGTVIGGTRAIGDFYVVSSIQLFSAIFKVLAAYLLSDSVPLQFLIYLCLIDVTFWFFGFIYTYINIMIKNNSNKKIYIKSYTNKDFFFFSYWGTLHSCLDLPVNHLDKIIVNFFLGPSFVGVLDLMKRVSQVVSQVATPVNTIFFPYLSRLAAENNIAEIKQLVSRLLKYLSACAFIMLVTFLLSFDLIDYYLFSNSLTEHKLEVTLYLCIQLVALVFVWIHPISVVYIKMKSIAFIIFLANLLYLIVLILLINKVSLYAAVFAFLVQVLSVIMLKGLFLSRHFKKNGL